MLLDEIKHIKSTPRDLRNFGVTLGVAALAFSMLALLFRGNLPTWLAALGAALLALGVAAPRALLPFQKIWMGIAVTMGYVVSRIILIVLFYTVLTPLSLVARACRKHFLDLSRSKRSYWHYRTPEEAPTKHSMEQQF